MATKQKKKTTINLRKEQNIQEYQREAYLDGEMAFVVTNIEADAELLKEIAACIRHKQKVQQEKEGLQTIHENVRRLNQLTTHQMLCIFVAWHGTKWADAIQRAYPVVGQRNIVLLGIGGNEQTKIPVAHGSLNSDLAEPCLRAYEKILARITSVPMFFTCPCLLDRLQKPPKPVRNGRPFDNIPLDDQGHITDFHKATWILKNWASSSFGIWNSSV